MSDAVMTNYRIGLQQTTSDYIRWVMLNYAGEYCEYGEYCDAGDA